MRCFLQVVGLAGVGDGLAAHHLAQEDAAVLERDLLERLRPEEAEAVHQDHAR